MSEVMRQLREQCGWAQRTVQLVRDLSRDEACDPLAEHPDRGSAKFNAGAGGLLEDSPARESTGFTRCTKTSLPFYANSKQVYRIFSLH
jgi:hypothetical protein